MIINQYQLTTERMPLNVIYYDLHLSYIQSIKHTSIHDHTHTEHNHTKKQSLVHTHS